MVLRKFSTLFSLCAVVVLASACKSSFEVWNVDYSHRLETVLTTGDDGIVEDTRHGLSFNILPFQYQEFNDSTQVQVEEVRLIRNAEGFYFITADGFKNVYVMESAESKLKLKKKIKVSEEGLTAPAFNLRSPYVELVEKETAQVTTLNEDGIQSDNKEEQS